MNLSEITSDSNTHHLATHFWQKRMATSRRDPGTVKWRRHNPNNVCEKHLLKSQTRCPNPCFVCLSSVAEKFLRIEHGND